MKLIIKHTLGVVLYSIGVLIVYFLSAGIGWISVFTKNTFVAEVFDFPSLIISFPFLWIKPGRAFDNSLLFVIMPLFWGIVIYCFVQILKKIKN